MNIFKNDIKLIVSINLIYLIGFGNNFLSTFNFKIEVALKVVL